MVIPLWDDSPLKLPKLPLVTISRSGSSFARL